MSQDHQRPQYPRMYVINGQQIHESPDTVGMSLDEARDHFAVHYPGIANANIRTSLDHENQLEIVTFKVAASPGRKG